MNKADILAALDSILLLSDDSNRHVRKLALNVKDAIDAWPDATVTEDALEVARKVYNRVVGEGWDICFACHGDPCNQYCPTCENEGRLWRDGAADPMRAAIAAAYPALMHDAQLWRNYQATVSEQAAVSARDEPTDASWEELDS